MAIVVRLQHHAGVVDAPVKTVIEGAAHGVYRLRVDAAVLLQAVLQVHDICPLRNQEFKLHMQ